MAVSGSTVVIVPRPRFDLGLRILRQLEAMADRLPDDLVNVETVFDDLGQFRCESVVVDGGIACDVQLKVAL